MGGWLEIAFRERSRPVLGERIMAGREDVECRLRIATYPSAVQVEVFTVLCEFREFHAAVCSCYLVDGPSGVRHLQL